MPADDEQAAAVEVRRLGRAERVREETRRAEEHGQVPKRPMSLHPSFRVEGLTRVAPSTAPPGGRFLESSRKRIVTSRDGNPLQEQQDPAFLTAQINDELRRLTPANRALRASKILDAVALLQLADPHGQSTWDLRRKVLATVFGERFLDSEENLPTTRSTGAHGGSVRSDNESGS
jgi:hypothetical protein